MQRHKKSQLSKSASVLISCLLGLGIVACTNANLPKLPTLPGLGGEAKKKAADALPENQDQQTARAIQVAWTSARASKCKFYFNDQKLKSSLIAYETRLQPDPAVLQKISQTYDYTRNTISQRIAANDEFCSKRKIEEIRKDLNRHLAGDFTPAPKRQVAEKKEAEILTNVGEEKWDPSDALFPGDNKPVR